jgi:NADH-quinone oxidoreductase subunit M
MGILSVLLWSPAIAALFITCIPSQRERLIRGVANLFAVLAFLVSCVLLAQFDQSIAEAQFNEYAVLNPKLGSAYALGIDGLSAPLLVLATLLSGIAILASTRMTDGVKSYHICVLVLEFSPKIGLFFIFFGN